MRFWLLLFIGGGGDGVVVRRRCCFEHRLSVFAMCALSFLLASSLRPHPPLLSICVKILIQQMRVQGALCRFMTEHHHQGVAHSKSC